MTATRTTAEWQRIVEDKLALLDAGQHERVLHVLAGRVPVLVYEAACQVETPWHGKVGT